MTPPTITLIIILPIAIISTYIIYYILLEKVYFSYTKDRKYRKCNKCNNVYKYYKDAWWVFNQGTIKDDCKCHKL